MWELEETQLTPRYAPRIHPAPIPTPGVFDEPAVCVTINAEWVSHVLGVLDALDQPDAWQGTEQQIFDARQEVRELALALRLGNCEPAVNMFDVRQNTEEPCILEKTADGVTWVPFAMLDLCTAAIPPIYDPPADLREDPARPGEPEMSFDGGVTWTDVFPAPGESPTPWTPPVAPTAANNDDERKCLAATRAALTISEFYKQTFGAFTAGFFNAVNDVNRFLYEVNKALFNLVYGEYYGMLNAIGWWDFDFTTHYTAPALAQTAIDDLTCLLYDNASVSASGVVTFDFGAVYDNTIATLGVNPGTAVTLLLGNMQEGGLNQAGTVQVTDELNSCCAPVTFEWGHEWEFLTSTDYSQAASMHYCAPLATWVSGQGWQGAVCNSEADQCGHLQWFFGAFNAGSNVTIHRFEADVYLPNAVSKQVATVTSPPGTYALVAPYGYTGNQYYRFAPSGASGEYTIRGDYEGGIACKMARTSIITYPITGTPAYVRRYRVFGNGTKPAFVGGVDLPQ